MGNKRLYSGGEFVHDTQVKNRSCTTEEKNIEDCRFGNPKGMRNLGAKWSNKKENSKVSSRGVWDTAIMEIKL